MPQEIKKKGKKCILCKKIIVRTRAIVNCIRVSQLLIKTSMHMLTMRRGTQIIILQKYRKETNVKYVTRIH